ncbi:MAG: penicillin acylase family protein [Ignavibacteria bacterium]|nr:penicillin acylase family protein [Ignavibacteria bacterium]
MNPVLKNILGILILLIIVFITVGILFNNLTKKSFYEESGTFKIKGITGNVNVYMTDFGVPHIYAENEEDMYFTLGVIHARERLWQMDLMRRVAEGKLTEIMGKEVLEYDILFRTLGIDKNSGYQYDKLSPVSKSLLNSYSAGVNNFIENNSKQLPLEFDILNYKPEQWKPEHSLMIVKLMAWELNLSWYTDVMFGEIVKKFGIDNAKFFFPDYPEDAPFIVKDDQLKIKSDTVKKPVSMLKSVEKNYGDISSLGKEFYASAMKFREFIGTEGAHVGSNSWVISGSRTESGKPLLANDPHLALQVPSKWFEVSLYNEKKKYSVCGFTIPGVPGVAIGHNDVISWGLTNLMCDDSDFYILKRDSVPGGNYIYRDKSFALDSSIESIKIKDENDEYVFTAYTTVLGPVVSGLSKTGFINNQNFDKVNEDEILTFRWTGFEYSDEIETFYKLNNAANWNEFKDALKTFGAPALNFVYADTAGNIGYRSAGFIPVRNFTESESAPFIPLGPDALWTSFVPFDELPESVNPAAGYIVTANNKPKNNYKYYISNLYEPHYRAERIEQLITGMPLTNEEESKKIQRDVYSIQAKEFCGFLFESFGDSSDLTPDIKSYLDILKQWDYEFRLHSTGAGIFAMFEVQLYKNLYKNELGSELFEDYLYLKNIPVRNTSKLLKLSSSFLFENNIIKRQIIRRSFYEAVSALISKYGNNPEGWKWDLMHDVYMRHPLGIVPEFSSMLNIGPFSIGGNGTTVNNLEYSFSKALTDQRFESYLGPSMRMIANMISIKNYLSILPTGQSGQPISPNYGDQARLWLNGDYKKVTTDFAELKKENLKMLSFEPAE